MNVVIIGIAITAGGLVLLWLTRSPKHGKHRATVPPTAAAHHPLPVVDTGLPTEAWTLPTRHTNRDPATGRYTRKEQAYPVGPPPGPPSPPRAPWDHPVA